MPLKAWLKRAVSERPALHSAASVVHKSVIRSELAAVRAMDAYRGRDVRLPAVDTGEVTAIVKAFERPASLQRLLASLRRLFPRMHVIVADDSRCEPKLSGVELIRLPFDSGVSAGRQAALARVITEFTWVLDDDFVLYAGSRLDHVLSLFQQYPELDLLGGPVINLPRCSKYGLVPGGLWPTKSESLIAPGTLLGPAIVCDKVPNFFVARTARLRRVDWTPEIRRLDHGDFFTRAKGTLVTAYLDSFRCLHVRTPFDSPYMQFRLDVAEDRALLQQRHRLSGA